jgi:uncharacterized membrane protein
VRLSAFAVRLVEGLTWSRFLAGLTALSLVWTVSLFLAPYTLPPGSFLLPADGGANHIDHGEYYAPLNPFAQAVYYVSDAQCHQLPYRSLYVNGNQMPMDARMVSIYLFANLGLLTAALIPRASTVSQGLLNVLPERARRWVSGHLRVDVAAGLLVLLTLLPVALDGFTQLFGWRESTNALRVLTGAITGWGGGLLVGVMVTSTRQLDLEVRAMRAAQAPQRF